MKPSTPLSIFFRVSSEGLNNFPDNAAPPFLHDVWLLAIVHLTVEECDIFFVGSHLEKSKISPCFTQACPLSGFLNSFPNQGLDLKQGPLKFMHSPAEPAPIWVPSMSAQIRRSGSNEGLRGVPA